MKIEITENIITGSIIYNLKEVFGDKYKYYDEEIIQGFQRPSFSVSKVDIITSKGYTGHQYQLTDNTYRYVIKYFTDEKFNKIKDINDKIDKLKQIFKYLNIINIKEDKVYSKLNRINSINITESDGTLLFQITFPLRTVEYLEIDKVKTKKLKINI
nr:MAG TPA: tail completion protein [Caudoviricetes sp.]